MWAQFVSLSDFDRQLLQRNADKLRVSISHVALEMQLGEVRQTTLLLDGKEHSMVALWQSRACGRVARYWREQFIPGRLSVALQFDSLPQERVACTLSPDDPERLELRFEFPRRSFSVLMRRMEGAPPATPPVVKPRPSRRRSKEANAGGAVDAAVGDLPPVPEANTMRFPSTLVNAAERMMSGRHSTCRSWWCCCGCCHRAALKKSHVGDVDSVCSDSETVDEDSRDTSVDSHAA